MDRPIPKGWWCGCCWATGEDHDGIEKIYGNQSFANLNFVVQNDLRKVEVSSHSKAANGIWTLANMKARYDLTPRQLAAMANRMRRAADVYMDQFE